MPIPLRLALCFLVLAAPLLSSAGAQELRVQRTPFSAYLDFATLAQAPNMPLPLWMRSFQRASTPAIGSAKPRTTFRLWIEPLDESERDILVRLFFDDFIEDAIIVTGRSASGVERFARGPFGAGLGLPSSESIIVPTAGVDLIEIETRGDATHLRGVYLSWLEKGETRQALDFAPAPLLADPFDNTPSHFPPLDDLLLAGRIRATIDPGVARLTPREAPDAAWEFDLGGASFLAVLSFEILNADPLAPLEVLVNDQPLGPAAMRTPDLADPGFQGIVRPVDRGVQFRYAGWLPCQKAIPGSALKAGTNRVTLRLPAASGPVAVRSLELQLKTQPQSTQTTLSPSTP